MQIIIYNIGIIEKADPRTTHPRKWLTSGRASGRKNKLDESPKAFFKATIEVGDQI